MDLDPSTTKYMIEASLEADGVVEKPDVVGAIFGQTEGLLGNELDLRDLQKSGRIGRIEVEVSSSKGKSEGSITLPSSLDKVETAILGSALESIDRVGPCNARIKVTLIDDVRTSKRQKVIDRAKELLHDIIEESKDDSADITETVRQTVRVEEIVRYGSDNLPAGPNVKGSDSIIVVEGRNDVLNLLKYGIKNAIAVEGTDIPGTVRDLTKERVATAFVDGDRGGELIVKEMLQTSEIDFVARAPDNAEVEELTQKQIMKSLRNKMPAEQFLEMYDVDTGGSGSGGGQRQKQKQKPKSKPKSKSSGSGSGNGNGGGGQRQQQKQQKQAKPKQQTKGGGDRDTRFLNLLDELSGKLQAVLLDEGREQLGDNIAVRELADTLKTKDEGSVDTVVFDGVVTQRLLDIAADKSIGTLVGVKTGNITKRPDAVEVITRSDLE